MVNTLNHDHWLKNLPESARKEVQRIIAELDRFPRDGRQALEWWIKYSPTTTEARYVELLRRVDGKIVWNRVIMIRGELVE